MSVDLATAQVDTIVRIGLFGGPHAPVSQCASKCLVFSKSPLRGPNTVSVFDLARRVEVMHYAGIQGVAADNAGTVVMWRMVGAQQAALVWVDARGDSGTIGEIAVESPALLEAPVRVGEASVYACLDGKLIEYDARKRCLQTLGRPKLVPLCDGGEAGLICRRIEDRRVVLVDPITGRVSRTFGELRSVGWARDAVNGGVLCAVPSGSWFHPDEFDLASLDLVSGRLARGVRGLAMTGGVVLPCSTAGR